MVFQTACKFWAYDSLKAWLSVDPGNPTMLERLASGGLAGTAAQALIYPMEVLKTRMALAGTGDYRGMWDCARTTVSVEGPRGLYRGLTASLVGAYSLLSHRIGGVCVYHNALVA
jgi:solute carrier family 25 (mitochondrial phosphate transporter), member 23/24/25/41